MPDKIRNLSILVLLLLLLASGPAFAAPPAAGADPEESAESEGLETQIQPCLDRLGQLGADGTIVQPLIATLPDPSRTVFGREFDLILASIIQAIEEEELSRDQVCLPWRLVGAEDARKEASRPALGMIVFRSPAKVVPLFLVGEDPILGIDTPALSTAIRRASALVQPPDGEPADSMREISILGPSFSASAASLNSVLVSWRDELLSTFEGERREAESRARRCKRAFTWPDAPPPVRVRIRTGSATATEVVANLEQGFTPDDGPWFRVDTRQMTPTIADLMACTWNVFVPDRLDLDVRLRADTYPSVGPGHPCYRAPADGDVEQDRGGPDNRRVALLVESSAYGSEFARSGFKLVRFPMHIARLRELYREKRRPASDEDAGDASYRPPIDLVRRPAGLPAYGEGITLASQEAELRSILHDIERRRYEVVGIVAVDVMDQRFLADQVRRLAPGTRVVTFEKDLLLARPGSGELAPSGILVASSFAADDARPPTDRRKSSFALDASEGVYLAARDLLGAGPESAPEKTVWLSVVAQGDLHTLTRQPLAAGSGGGKVSRREAEPNGLVLSGLFEVDERRLPRGWGLLLAIFTGALLWAVSWLARTPRTTGEGGGAGTTGADYGVIARLIPRDLFGWPSRRRYEALDSEADRVLHALVVLLPVVFVIPYLVVGIPMLAWALPRFPTFGWLSGSGLTLAGHIAPLVAGLAIVLFFVSLYLLFDLTARSFYDGWKVLRAAEDDGDGALRNRLREALGVFAPLAATVVLVAIALVGAKIWIDQGWLSENGEYFLRRSITPSTGVPPLLPALLFGGVLLGWIVLSLYRHRSRRAIPTGEMLDALELPENGTPHRIGRQIVRLRRAIDPGALHQDSTVLWSLLVATPVAYLCLYYGRLRWPLHSLELRGFDATVSVLFLLALIVSIGSGISLLRGWGALRSVLDGLLVLDPSSAWTELIGEAQKETDSSISVAEGRRRQALDELREALRASEDESAARLKELFLSDTGSSVADPGRPMGRWLAVADWLASRKGGGGAADPLETVAQKFFARSVVRFVRDAFAQLMQLMGFMTVALLLMLVAISVYPFEPQRVLTVYVITLIALGASLSIWVVLQARRQPHLGTLEGSTTPGWQVLAGRLGAYVGLPLLSVVANRVPLLRQVLTDWLKPLLEAFG